MKISGARKVRASLRLFVPNARTLNVQISKDHVAIIFSSFDPTSFPADSLLCRSILNLK